MNDKKLITEKAENLVAAYKNILKTQRVLEVF
jgi:hypothetical protein